MPNTVELTIGLAMVLDDQDATDGPDTCAHEYVNVPVPSRLAELEPSNVPEVPALNTCCEPPLQAGKYFGVVA